MTAAHPGFDADGHCTRCGYLADEADECPPGFWPATPNFDRFMRAFKVAAEAPDATPETKRLYAIFDENRVRVGQHFEGMLDRSWFDKLEGLKPQPVDLEWFGEGFHKGFRTPGVVPGLDVEVWHLLRGEATAFWTVIAGPGVD